MKQLLSLTLGLGLLASAFFGPASVARAGDNDDKVVTFLVSADELIADAKHIVVELAGEKEAWESSVLPNIEIWLFGVKLDQPVGLDVQFDADTGRGLEFHVPIESPRRTFLSNNLGDVGITAKVDRKNKDLYELSDVLNGWLLFTESSTGQEYGSIVTKKANLPTSCPASKFEIFKKAGYEAGIRWVALESTKAERDKAFAKLQTEVLSNVKKRPDETAAQFELRKLTLELNTTRLTRMLSGTAELMAGWTTDAKGRKYGGSSTMTGLPGSNVEKNIASIGTEASRFASVTTPDNAAMMARTMLPLAEVYQKEQAQIYAASLTALKERIDNKAELSADEKTARKSVSEKIVQIASDSLSLGWLDVYAELLPSKDKLYTGIAAVRVKDPAVAKQIVEELPKAQPGWTVKVDMDEEAGAKIHQINMQAKLPSTLKTHFGEAGEAYVATAEQTVWIAAGPDALTRLKAALKAAAAGGSADKQKPLQVMMHVSPALEIGKSLTEDRDIELFRTLNEGTLLKGNRGEAETKNGKPAEERRVNRNALQNFKWQETALEALKGGNDVVTLEVFKDGTALKSELKAEEGVMKAVGKIVAKFAVEMLQ